ncbi:MAG: sulfur-oxidizing protein SoxX [Paracoccaceae bacterium]|jgi:sulfur-oxidizing protein SoxX
MLATVAVASLIAGAATAEAVAPDAVIFSDGSVTQSLTGVPGDPAKGAKWFAGRKLGNCLACHENPDMPNEPFQGETGPSLEGVGGRYGEAHLRGMVVNSKMTFEDTMMPSFYRVSGFFRPAKDFAGKSILDAQQVEDVVAYLKTLTEK